MEKWLHASNHTEEELKKQAQIMVAVNMQIAWKKSINLIRINIFTRYKEQGIPNELDDIEVIG